MLITLIVDYISVSHCGTLPVLITLIVDYVSVSHCGTLPVLITLIVDYISVSHWFKASCDVEKEEMLAS